MEKRLFLTSLCAVLLFLTIAFVYYRTETVNTTPAKAAETGLPADSSSGEAAPSFPAVSAYSSVTDPDSLLVLVNKNRTLSADYVPADLVRPNVAFSFGEEEAEQAYMRQETAAALEKMFHAAAKDGLELLAVSGYRSYKHQSALFNTYIKKYGKEEAETFSAPPGASEHQTGLAVDITARSASLQLTVEFGDTPEGKWMASHAHEYGFIIRYKQGKTDLTGYQYEPWHIRYVGNPYASYLHQHDLTLEEAMKAVAKKSGARE